jgi:hypothetical protein
MLPALVPNVTLLALEKANVVNENDPLEAEATGVTPPPGSAADKLRVNPAEFDAVVPDRLVKARVGLPWLWSLRAAVVRALWLAVITDPLSPKLIPLELEKVRALRLLLVVPAETLIAEISPAIEGTV